ncbi:MAG: heat-inducible transcription repressor HrcA [Clostridia bacterium]|nr:heat-inducible transcription repressor HrcA [Clostridia bacterium]MBO7245801.1 heat-inducible transcription repressor HrcA [Clostridia bacterium]MBO7737614.1 heat-inducible transcription repressor HrcA [Clostridia bacterium]MBQ5842397.1 heat-inducible transcription repressor HrcA [Clostridia bacterium]
MELSERKKKILKSVIDSYIRTGEPVGSKLLTGTSDLQVSSATIRNEMNELERMGYLEQPHASAGRVPTAEGYRTYVDGLMEQYLLSLEELKVLNEVFNYKVSEIERLMESASHAISEMTNYTSFSVIRPSGRNAQRFETLYIDEHSFLLIMICTDGSIRNRHVKVRMSVDPEMLKTVADALNATMSGVCSEDVTLQSVLEFEERLGAHSGIAATVLRVIYDMLNSTDSEKVHIDGVTKLLSYPEFSDVEKAKDAIALFEDRRDFAQKIMSRSTDEKGLTVHFGEADLPDAGIVLQPIIINGKTVGAIGVMGPKRMDYKKVIASLQYFVDNVGKQFEGESENEQEHRKKPE